MELLIRIIIVIVVKMTWQILQEKLNIILPLILRQGDYPLKDRKVVVSEPDVLSFQLSTEPHLRPEFAVLASDGLWDIFSNEEAVAHVRKQLISFGGSKSEIATAKSLAKEAYAKGSTDNVTVLIINLKKMFLNWK